MYVIDFSIPRHGMRREIHSFTKPEPVHYSFVKTAFLQIQSHVRNNMPSSPKAKRLMDTITEAHRMSYRIGRGEQGVLTFEPYKSHILPLWRFRTVPIARRSAEDLWAKF